ncbi:amphi-Trp domain-containing protein [Halobacteriales archaeon QS_8_65_32]|jgi:amphi-Trp domain-containing protein|nr:MAG: amphi-Trp domain-containing protein [Halobacteriales archaeon QS_8_65_32]
MPEEVLFETEQGMDRSEIASYLRAVAGRLEGDGTLALSAGSQDMTLEVPSRPTFEVKAERETGSGPPELSVEFELEWDEGQDTGEGENGSLTIE